MNKSSIYPNNNSDISSISPTLFDGLKIATKEELAYLIALLRQQTMKNIVSDKFNSTVTTGKKAINTVMSLFGKSQKTNIEIEQEQKENYQDINAKIQKEIQELQNYPKEVLYDTLLQEIQKELKNNTTDLLKLSNDIIECAAKTDKAIDKEYSTNQKADAIYQKTLQSIKSTLEKQSIQERDEMICQLDQILNSLSAEKQAVVKQSLKTEHLTGEVLRNSILKSGIGIGSLIAVGGTFSSYIAINTIIHAVFTTALSMTVPFAVYTGVAKGVSIITGPIGWCALGGYSIYSLAKTSGKLTAAIMSVIVFIAITLYGKSFLVDENGNPLWFTTDSFEYQDYKKSQYEASKLRDTIETTRQESKAKNKKLYELEKNLKAALSNTNDNKTKELKNELDSIKKERNALEKKCDKLTKKYTKLQKHIQELDKQNNFSIKDNNTTSSSSLEFH